MNSTVIINEMDSFLRSDSSKKVEFISSWRSKGTYPRSVFPKLLEIFNYYFEVGERLGFPSAIDAYPQFPILICQFVASLNAAHPDDLRFFCAQSTLVDKSKIYLTAILKKLLVCDLDNIKGQMESLARILSRYDPSYIVDSPVLEKIYAEDFLGPSFSFSYFKKKCLPLLRSSELVDTEFDVLPAIIQELDLLAEKVKQHTDFSDEILADITRVYKLRWNQNKGTALDYTRIQPGSKQYGKNATWIMVAQLLCGAKLIPPDYYYFLMGTLERRTVLATGEPLENYPLHHYILSEGDRGLISLDISLDYVESSKGNSLFCNREELPLRPFTALEIERIKYTFDRFSGRTDLLKQNLQSPVRRTTVNIVYELLMSSLRKPITEVDLVFAYLKLCEKLSELESDERDRLHSQRIVWNGDDYTVYDVLSNIALGDVKEGCTTKWGAYLLKFVIDYRPEVYLSTEIDRLIRVQLMREQSANKKFRETDADIMKRNEMLMVSLLTHPFSYRLLSGSTLSLCDCNNHCDSMLVPFFLSLKTKIETNVRIDAYAELMSQMVLPSLLAGNMSTLPDDVQSWLKLIRDENYLSKSNLCFDPKTLFCILYTFDLSANNDDSVKIFLDDLIKIFIQRKNESIMHICVNVKLKYFLAALPEIQRNILVEALRSNNEPIQNQDFIKLLYSYVVTRSSSLAISFFSSSATPRISVSQICLPDLSGLNSVDEVLSFVREKRVSADRVKPNEANPVQCLF